MPKLKLIRSDGEKTIIFEGSPVLSRLLRENGFYLSQPCGGSGRCGKCQVKAEGKLSVPTDIEKKLSCRLACQTRLMGDALIYLEDRDMDFRIEESVSGEIRVGKSMDGRFGAAVDIGTTTVVVHVYALQSGQLVGKASAPNPQRSVASDVMGRISAALEGQGDLLRDQICSCIESLFSRACAGTDIAPKEILSLVITGNTTMLYLLTGTSPLCLSHAPFEMGESFGFYTEILGRKAYLPQCMHAFVGADITCSVLSSGLCEKGKISLLCDIGTNGELALWKDGKLYITSTAAGPAFEGAGISCGCGSVPGAVDSVSVIDGRLCVHTIDDASPLGLCGSGLIDAAAAFLRLGDIDETGAIEKEFLPLNSELCLMRKDVRALQLAKAAVAAGIELLMELSHTSYTDIDSLYIAGGFGSHLNVHSACDIGLIPDRLCEKACAIGNAALKGASMLLLDTELIPSAHALAECSVHVDLGGNPAFNSKYIEHMMFPE